jgi:hypothetical protein
MVMEALRQSWSPLWLMVVDAAYRQVVAVLAGKVGARRAQDSMIASYHDSNELSAIWGRLPGC